MDETVSKIIQHLDSRLDAQDSKRAEEFRSVYGKLDAHSREARLALQEFRTETTAAFGELSLKVERHDMRIGAIESIAEKADDRQHDWKKVGVSTAMGGGVIFLIWEKLKEAFK